MRFDSAPTRDTEDLVENGNDDSASSLSSTVSLKRTPWRWTIEPVAFFQMVGLTCSAVIAQNFFIDRVCRLDFDQPESVCANLTDYELLESQVQGKVAKLNTLRTAIETILPCFFSFFLGPWIDKHGAKFSLLFPILGQAISSCFYIFFLLNYNLQANYILISAIPVALSGGLISILLSMFSYISYISRLEDRSFRISLLEGCWFLGNPIGMLAGDAIFRKWGFLPVFGTSAACYLTSFLIGLVQIKDDRGNNDPFLSKLSDFFDFNSVRQIFKTILKPRENCKRRWIGTLIFTICLRIFSLYGALNVLYLCTMQKFKWTEQEFTYYTVIDGSIQVAGTMSITFIGLKLLKFQDGLIGAFSSIGYCAAALLFAFATRSWMMYLASLLQTFSGCITMVLRSMVSKLVEKEEVAKAFTVIACAEAAVPILSSTVYNLIYKETSADFPGAAFLLSFGVNALIALIMLVRFFTNRNPGYSIHVNEE